MTEKTLPQLAAEYNALAAIAGLPPVKRFADKPSALKRIASARETANAGAPEQITAAINAPTQPAPEDFVHDVSGVPTPVCVVHPEVLSTPCEERDATPANVVSLPVFAKRAKKAKLVRAPIDLRTEMSEFPVVATIASRTRDDFIAAAVAKAKAAPAPSGKKGRGVTATGTRASAVRALIIEGKLTDDEILAEVRKTYPALPNNAVRYYREKMGL